MLNIMVRATNQSAGRGGAERQSFMERDWRPIECCEGGGEQTWFRGPAVTERVHLNFGKANGERENLVNAQGEGGESWARYYYYLRSPLSTVVVVRIPTTTRYRTYHTKHTLPYPTVCTCQACQAKGTLLGPPDTVSICNRVGGERGVGRERSDLAPC